MKKFIQTHEIQYIYIYVYIYIYIYIYRSNVVRIMEMLEQTKGLKNTLQGKDVFFFKSSANGCGPVPVNLKGASTN